MSVEDGYQKSFTFITIYLDSETHEVWVSKIRDFTKRNAITYVKPNTLGTFKI